MGFVTVSVNGKTVFASSAAGKKNTTRKWKYTSSDRKTKVIVKQFSVKK